MSIIEGVLWALSYTLIGVCIFTVAVRHFRQREWLSYEDLLEISMPFLIFWPLGLLVIIGHKIEQSAITYKILKLINGR